MAVSTAAVFNICSVIRSLSFILASSCALKLAEGCRGRSGATNVVQILEKKKRRTAAESLLK